ncbi:hypothetical protein JQ609_04290 [Bradyrhizobium sp. AUGA SZCCT0169]|uniref:hypothetical protein n=1 Tax=Bradyrhizobium sp. AUGA SZCCT0169 TaxID=2807663 RepID=UPI001BA83FB7|nr:hypothetical protein [Bradyrhizobium sp. AUGA SZCCT0169]MBR1246148.1 hypothetical protein [Bradyrhizobium sp. AUGA SZCCT0169]
MTKPVQSSVLKLARALTSMERGELPDQDVAEFLIDGFRRAIFEKCPIERGLELYGKWRGQMLVAEQRASLSAIPRIANESTRAAARSLREKLIRYRSRSFDLDKSRQPEARSDPELFRLLESRDGKVPSLTVLRGLLGGPPTTMVSGHGIPDDQS